jgi:formylmethanofuran dehydrogenase subunit E
LVKPFRDHAVERTAALREEMANGDLVVEWAACPGCGERRVDELTVNEDESVVCSTCSRRYWPKGSQADDA